MTDDTALAVWVIYHGVKDHPPGVWVVRAQDVTAAGVVPRDDCTVHESLEGARAAVPPGLYRMERYPADDPVIVECWF